MVALTVLSLLSACGGLSEKQKTTASDALKALRRMSAATEVGVNYQQYGQLAIEAKSQVNEAAAVLPDGALKTELNAAMDAYADAGQAWSVFVRDSYLDNQSEPGKTLAKKYPIDISTGHPVAQRRPVLSTIWGAAKTHVDRAAKLLGE
jgi:hypothetical protein